MSSLRERIEGLVRLIEASRDGFLDGKPYILTYSDIINELKELATTLAAEGPMPPAIPQGWEDHVAAKLAAPSLHKEGALPAIEILNSLRMKLGAESMIQHRVNDYITDHLDRLEAALHKEGTDRDAARKEALEEAARIVDNWRWVANPPNVHHMSAAIRALASPAGPDAQLMGEPYEDYLKRVGKAEQEPK